MNVTVRNFRGTNDVRGPVGKGYYEQLCVIPTGGSNQAIQAMACNTTAGGAALTPSATPVRFKKLFIYPASAAPNPATGGPLTANAHTIFIGKSAAAQPDALQATDLPSATTDGNILKIENDLGECMDLNNLYLYGTAGDGVFLSWL